MPQRKSIALYRKNLLIMKNSNLPPAQWLYSHSEFDPKGNITEQSVYSQDGTLVERTINEYDANGFLVREKFFIDEEEASEEKSYERDENGLVRKEFKHYADGSCDTTTYQYDSQFRITSKLTTNDDGEVEEKTLNEYRDDFLVRSEVMDGEGNLLQLDEFKYDAKGNSVEHKRTDSENGENAFVVTSYNSSGRKQEEVSYDEDGDVIHETSYQEDEKGRLVSIIEEGVTKNVVITFAYDENNNTILQEEHDTQGRQLVSVKREYDHANNMVRSEVYVDGQGLTLPQHYEVIFEYTFFDD